MGLYKMYIDTVLLINNTIEALEEPQRTFCYFVIYAYLLLIIFIMYCFSDN